MEARPHGATGPAASELSQHCSLAFALADTTNRSKKLSLPNDLTEMYVQTLIQWIRQQSQSMLNKSVFIGLLIWLHLMWVHAFKNTLQKQYLLLYRQNLLITIHLSHSGLLFPHTHYDDAVRLSDATLSPRSQRTVRLIQNNPVDVLLLTQPAWQTILMNTENTTFDWKNIQCISICILPILNGMRDLNESSPNHSHRK